MRLELHCHSTASDGGDAPAEVGRRAAGLDLALFCLTDHDTCGGWAEAEAAYREAGGAGRTLRGVEMSVAEGGRTVHLLVYDVAGGAGWAELEGRLGEQARARQVRMRSMLAHLAARGVAIEMADVEEEARGAVMGRPHLARALVRRGHARSVSEVFDRWLGDGGPADVPLDRFGVADALELARAAGARVSLAHPHTLGPSRAADLVRRNRDEGLGGLEAWYGSYAPRERDEWARMAAELGAVVTGGSDYHGVHLPDIAAPGIDMPEPHAARLLDWLAS